MAFKRLAKPGQLGTEQLAQRGLQLRAGQAEGAGDVIQVEQEPSPRDVAQPSGNGRPRARRPSSRSHGRNRRVWRALPKNVPRPETQR